MAIKAEKSSFCMQRMGTCQDNGGNSCNDDNQQSMQINIVPENVCLESSEEMMSNSSHANYAQEDDNTGFKKLPRTLLLQIRQLWI